MAAAEATTLTQVTSALNQVMLEAHNQVDLIETATTLTINANALGANLPADFIRMISVLNGTLTMAPVTEQDLIAGRAQTAAGTAFTFSTVPVYYTVRTLVAGPQIQIWPSPTASTSLSILYVARPAVMANATDTPGAIPADFHWMLVEAAAERVAANEEMLQPGAYAGQIAQRLFAMLRVWKATIAGPSSQSRVRLAFFG